VEKPSLFRAGRGPLYRSLNDLIFLEGNTFQFL
jgi:hypothetical protein